MRVSIRSQVLIPVVAVQTAAVASLAMAAAGQAAWRAEAQVVNRLDAVIATLGRATFPPTPAVLEAMRGLSGAHFVALTPGGEVRASTLDGLPARLPSLRALPDRVRLDAPGRSASLVLGGSRFAAAWVRGAGGQDRPTLLVLYPEAAWRRARWEAATPPVAVGLAALATMVAVTGLVAERLGRRLRSLEAKAAAIASGDFRPLAIDRRGDEVADLAAAVNRMCEQLQEMRAAIRRAERSGVLAQLAAGLAHSLRNAATGARMAVQLHARRCSAGPEDRSLDVALRQLALGEEQVRALLTLGAIRAPERERIEATWVIEEVAALIEPACRHARVAFQHSGEPGLRLAGDAGSLRAAVLNLTLNAIEAAGAEGSVDLQARGEEGRVRFEVADSGPGPPPELAGTLFEPFVTGKPEGVGLGLAVVRRVAADHGGAVSWARDGARTRFALVLPRERGTA